MKLPREELDSICLVLMWPIQGWLIAFPA